MRYVCDVAQRQEQSKIKKVSSKEKRRMVSDHQETLEDRINGLRVLNDFITEAEEAFLLDFIESRQWCGEGVPPNAHNRRRTQQYGFLVNLQNGTIPERYGPFPQELHFLIDRLQTVAGVYTKGTDDLQLLVNEYKNGMGILPHNDSVKLFGPSIVGLSLSAQCVMTMVNAEMQVPITLARRSLLVLEGDARNVWHHSITAGQQELIDGRRISLTFRTIQPEAMP
ncbi:hypothetical protein HDU83_004435 [Entophlyctis luteolus]|nr:hypothetical protein HDU83_004435 [Entophlyctis luteolus]